MKKIISVSILLLDLLFAVAQPPLATLPKSNHRFIVIAHRGDHIRFPENTLAAFEEAVNNEVDYIEMDLRTTKDSMLVLMHDATIDRMTGGKGKINDLTYAQLSQLKIRGGKTDSSETHSIPKFEDVLAYCLNKINIYLDFKDASVLQAFGLLQKYAMDNQVIVYINSLAQYKDWRKIAPQIPLIVSLPDSIKTAKALNNFLTSFPAAVLDGNYNDYTAEMVAAAMAAGVPVWPDIQSKDEAGNWAHALTRGFTGLQTDHPAALIAYLKKTGKR